jgi:hypothetical protein
MTSLAGVFVALLGLVAVAIALYAPRYHEPGRGTAVYLAAYNLALLACLAVLAAGGMVTFLVAWETMSLTLLPAHPAPGATRRRGPRRVLVPRPVRDRLPAGRGRVRDPPARRTPPAWTRSRPARTWCPAAGEPPRTCSR